MTQEDSPSGEDAREVEEDEEAAEDVAEPKVAPKNNDLPLLANPT